MTVIRTNTATKPKRGELYYVHPQASWDNDDSENGTSRTDVKSGRPAIVIGNNAGNDSSDMCVIAWLTRQDKSQLPEHITVPSGPAKDSTMLLEHPITVSQIRLGDKISTCSDALMKKVDSALLVSIGLCDTIQDAEYMLECREMVHDLQAKVDMYERKLKKKDFEVKSLQQELENSNLRLTKLEDKLNKVQNTANTDDKVRLELVTNERDYLRDIVKLSMKGGTV